MSTLNDLKFKALSYGKTSNNLDDLEREWLGATGVSGFINGLWVKKFTDDGIAAAAFNDMAYEWLGNQGYSGATNLRWYKFWKHMLHDHTHDVNLIKNGGFNDSSEWVLGNGWSISGGEAHNHGEAGELSQVLTGLEAGKIYTLIFEIHGSHTEGLKISVGGGAEKTITSDGEHKITFVAGAGNQITLTVDTHDGFSGTVDNIKLQKTLDQTANAFTHGFNEGFGA